MLTQIHWQTDGQVTHIALCISWPLTPDEMASLAELRLFRKLTQLDVQFSKQLRFETDEELQRVITQTYTHIQETMNLGLQSLMFGNSLDDDHCVEMFWALVLLNRHTLLHVAYREYSDTNKWQETPLDVVEVLHNLVLFKANCSFTAVVHESDMVDIQLPFQLPVSSSKWVYLDLMRYELDGGFARVPVGLLPSSLRAASLCTDAKSKWTCPVGLECVEISRTDVFRCDLRLILPVHFPVDHAYAKLEYMSLEMRSYRAVIKADEDAFEVWLSRTSFPALHTLAVNYVTTLTDICLVTRLVTLLPALHTVYLRCVDMKHVLDIADQDLKTQKLIELIAVSSTRGITLHTGWAFPTLYKDYLRRNNVPCLDKYSHHAHITADGTANRILHLRPTSLGIVRPYLA
jgi:hypothetical protein